MMGLDVGVVRVSYLERPPQPIYDFLWELATDTGDDAWGGAWEGNAFIELTRRQMLSRARSFARKRGLNQVEIGRLHTWIKSLPWDGDTIMLHLNW